MTLLTRLPRWRLILAAATLACIAVLAALHLGGGQLQSHSMRDPLKPDAFAKDETGEIVRKRMPSTDLPRAEKVAEEKFGALPADASAAELALHTEMDDGQRALSDIERLREIRRTQGSAAAVAAMKSLRPIAAP